MTEMFAIIEKLAFLYKKFQTFDELQFKQTSSTVADIL